MILLVIVYLAEKISVVRSNIFDELLLQKKIVYLISKLIQIFFVTTTQTIELNCMSNIISKTNFMEVVQILLKQVFLDRLKSTIPVQYKTFITVEYLNKIFHR
jgi:hypothetical protein